MRRLRRISIEEDSKSTTVTSLTQEVPTSAYTLLSCVHGRDRRQLRQIGKRDLKAAVKYGEKERGFPHPHTGAIRWKYTFKNVVYITDATSTVEITSYVKPIEIREAYVTSDDVKKHEQLSTKLRQRPDLLTSHTVFIVDQSGSMKTHDVDNFLNRSEAVFGTLALDYIGKQIDQSSISHTDCASLILMADDGELVIEREAIDNVLYNKILRLKGRTPGGHGKYLPSLKKAANLLEIDKNNPKCAVLILFLSDGRPSDCSLRDYFGTMNFLGVLKQVISEMSEALGDRLTFGSIGFNSNETQFDTLQKMCDMAKEKGSKSMFQHAKGDSETLSIAVSTLTKSIIESRTQLTALAEMTTKTRRNIKETKFHLPTSLYPDSDWNIFTINLKVCHWNKIEKSWDENPVSDGVRGIAMRKECFGVGAERLVFHLRKLGRDNKGALIFLPGEYVAKETKFVEDEQQKYHFHTTFYTTQMKAQDIAVSFNEKISLTKRLHSYIPVAKIKFLQCWVYTFIPDPDRLHDVAGVMCEKKIDHTKYQKWNSNNGFVDMVGGLAQNRVGANGLPQMSLNAILEDSSEEENESDDGEINPIQATQKKYNISLSDYPQCFSHFSYRKTNRKMLVCDLQGVFDSSQDPPVYELTDPVIHYSPLNKGDGRRFRKRKFGRTDLGENGINKFFETHRCNDLCALLGLPRE